MCSRSRSAAVTRARPARRRAQLRDPRSGRPRTRSRPTAARGSSARRRAPSAVEACVIRAGCSIRLSTPPRLSASVQTFVRATRSTASSSVSTRNEIIPPKSRICRGGELVSRVAGQAGVEHALDPRLLLEERGDGAGVLAVALHADRKRLHPAQHQPRVERRPARRRATSAGSAAARRSWGRSSRRSRRRRPSGRRCTSSSSGRRCRRRASAAAAGRAWRRCCRPRAARRRRGRQSATARMSTMFSSGFVGVSIQTSRVCSSIAAASSSGDDERELVALRLVDLGEHPVGAAVDVVDGAPWIAGRERGA